MNTAEDTSSRASAAWPAVVGLDQRRLRERHREKRPRYDQDDQYDRTDELAQADGHIRGPCAPISYSIKSSGLGGVIADVGASC
jgi:hypothetical protein